MTEAEKKHRSRVASPTVMMEWSQYLVLDCCLRDRMRYYHLEDLVEA